MGMILNHNDMGMILNHKDILFWFNPGSPGKSLKICQVSVSSQPPVGR